MNDPTTQIVADIQSKGKEALKPLYLKIKPQFLSYMQRYTSDRDLLLDAFHEAMIAFYEYVLGDKFDAAKGTARTLIFQMGKAYLINRLKKERRLSNVDTFDVSVENRKWIHHEGVFQPTEDDPALKHAISMLGEKCRDLLFMFFYENFSVAVIKERMNYKNVNVVSSHKSRCLKQLRIILDKNELGDGTGR